MSTRRTRPVLLGTLGLVALGAVWQWAAAGPLSGTSFPSAIETLSKLWVLVRTGAFWSQVGETLATAGIGFGIAALIGVPLGILVGLNRWVRAALRLPLEVFKPIPPIVILPLVVYRLGPTASMSRFLIVVGLVPMIVIATAAGVADVDPLATETAQSFRLNAVDRSWRIVLPSAGPFIVTGLRIAAFGALLTAVMSQIVGGAPGLGSGLSRALRSLHPDTAYAYVLAIAVLGLLADRLVTAAERWVLHWHVSVRGADAGGHAGWLRRRLHPLTTTAGDAMTRVVRALPARLGSGRRAGAAWQRWRDRLVLPIVSLATAFGLLAWWWIATDDASSSFFVPLRKIVRRFRAIWLFDRFGSDAVPSLRNLAVGFAIAAVVGVSLGLAIAASRILSELLEPVLALFRSLPGVAFVPILVTVMGFDTSMRVTTIAIAASFPVIIATVDGVRALDTGGRDVSVAYRLPTARRIFSVYLPAAAPRIFAGMEIALATAVVVMIASELNGVTVGIGAQTMLAQQTFEFADMWAGVLLLALVGVLTNAVFRVLQRYALRWYRGWRAASRAT